VIRDDWLVEAFMVNAQTESTQHTDGGARWVTAITSLITGTAFFALWFWLLPSWLGFQPGWGQRAGMALDRSGVLGVRVQRGAAMRVGLWMDRPRHARAGGSPEETRGGRVLSIRAESDVFGIFCGMGGAVGGFWPRELGTDRCGSGCGPGRRSIRAAV
jgi:hypothetical protein